MSLLSDYSERLAMLLPVVGTAAFGQRLVTLLESLAPINDATIIAYAGNNLPSIEYFQPRANGETSLGQFVNAAFLLDPFYQQAALHDKYGFFRLQELAPDGFHNSEYYRTFFRHSGYQDECGYLVATDGNSFVNISLAINTPQPFSQQQLALLADAAPVIENLCRQHWSAVEPVVDRNESNLRALLQSALDGFGRTLLTNREAQVVNLMLHGYSSRMAAETLQVSIETVKLHRKHSYAKLDIGSQAELFYLFLDSLMSAKDYAGGDALQAYLQTPKH